MSTLDWTWTAAQDARHAHLAVGIGQADGLEGVANQHWCLEALGDGLLGVPLVLKHYKPIAADMERGRPMISREDR